jgi:hypothetical protein
MREGKSPSRFESASDLTSVAFGQPTARLTQVFGSGGPRAFQFATRLAF